MAYAQQELQTLSEAFAKCDCDHSSTLDLLELGQCLVSVGISGKNAAERQKVRDVLWATDALEVTFAEFSGQVVPEIRRSLRELRRPRLEEIFSSIDAPAGDSDAIAAPSASRRSGNTGDGAAVSVSLDDAIEAIRRLGAQVPRRAELLEEVVRAFAYTAGVSWLQHSDGQLDLEHFVKFVPIMQERVDHDNREQFEKVADALHFTKEQQEQWRYDILDLYRHFHTYDPMGGRWGSPTGTLSGPQVMTILQESGYYMPKSRSKQVSLHLWIQEAKRSDDSLGFMEFLAVVKRLRDEDRQRLAKVLELRYGSEPGVTAADVMKILPDVGVLLRTREERLEVVALIEEFDEEGSEFFTLEDCVILCQLIARQMHTMQQERERHYCLTAGWAEAHYLEFRRAFQNFDEDMSGELEFDELMRAVELLRGSCWQSEEHMNLMLTALGIDPSNKETRVNFLTFLRMVKTLDDSEHRRQQGAAVGFSRDRSDMLHSVFQGLEPESDGAVRRSLLEQVVVDFTDNLQKAQRQEVMRLFDEDPKQVEFGTFLKIMKIIDTVGELDDCLRVLASLGWKDRTRSQPLAEIVEEPPAKNSPTSAATAKTLALAADSETLQSFRQIFVQQKSAWDAP